MWISQKISLYIHRINDSKYSKLLVSMLVLAFLLLIFFPGFMSGDSINQYIQATGMSGFEDWHPPIMAILWRFLVLVTGTWKSYIIVQLFTLVLASYIFSREAEKLNRRSLSPWLFISLPLLPFVLSISGVLWKDVMMAFLVLLICGLLMAKPRKNATMLSAFSLAVILAASFRHNAITIVLPFAIYFSLYFIRRNRLRVTYLISMVALSFFVPLFINTLFNVQERHVEMAVMIDDIQNLTTPNSPSRQTLPVYIQEYLSSVDGDCDPMGIKTNSLFTCGDINTYVQISVDDFEGVKSYWISVIRDSPYSYIKYRFHTFVDFIRPANNNYVWQNGIDQNSYGAIGRYGNYQISIRNFVQGFENDASYLFKPYFWLFLSICNIVFVFLKRRVINPHVSGVSLLMSSISLIYILSFIPVVIVNDYRMTYLAVLLSSASTLLLIVSTSKKQQLKK